MNDYLRCDFDLSEEELRCVDLTLSSETISSSSRTKSRRLGMETDAVDDQDVLCASSCSPHSTVRCCSAFLSVEPLRFLPQGPPEFSLLVYG